MPAVSGELDNRGRLRILPGGAYTGLSASGTGPQGRFAYDPAVLSPAAVSFDTTGTLSSGFSITPNPGALGSLQISGFGTDALAGAGTLIYLKFNVIASPPA